VEDFMAQTMINFRMDLEDKISLESVCEKLGMSVSTAFKIFAKKMIREQRIPFEVSVDNFYSKENIKYLEKITSEIDSGKAILSKHELIED
jgi:DNA-damage-inducible protein J